MESASAAAFRTSPSSALHNALKATGMNRHVQLPGRNGGAGFSHLLGGQGKNLYLSLEYVML